MSTLGQLAEWLVRLTEGDSRPPPAQPGPAGPGLESLRRVIGAYARLHRSVPETGSREVLFRWGQLEVLDRIGSGSYGEVYRAFDGVLERDVALKLRSSEQVAARAYILEARRLARVRHPHVLAIHGAAVNDGRVGIWSDLIDGQTLSAWVAENGPRPRAEVLAGGRMLASALAAVHRAGLIHGDVKPGNIMRGADGGLVLMDFGAAIERAAGGARATLGSPLTMAPEQLDGSHIGPAADLYALGVVLFHLATGRYPLESGSIDGLAGLHARGAVADVEPLVRTLGRASGRLVERLLARDPAARPTAEEALDVLREIERAPQRRQKRLAVGAVIVALSLALAASGIGYLRVRDEARRAEQVKDFVLSLFQQANAFDVSNRGEADSAELLRNGVARVRKELADQPRVQAELLVEIAGGLWRLGERAEAEATDRYVLELLERMDRPDPNVYAHTLKTLGSITRGVGDLEAAQDYYQRALAISDHGGVGDDIRFSILTGLGSLASERGNHEESLAIRQRILRERIVLRGADDPDVAMDHYNLGASYLSLNRYAEAEQSYRRSESLLVASLGADHPRRFYVDQALASVQILQGHPGEADALLADAVRSMLALGLDGTPIHTSILKTRATALRLQHRAKEALPLIDEALHRVATDETRLDRAFVLRERGACLAALARWADAGKDFAAAQSILANTGARPRFEAELRARRFHAAWRGRADPTAIREIAGAVDALERDGNAPPRQWLVAATLLGRVLRAQGEVDAALDLNRSVLDTVVELSYMGAIGRATAQAEVALSEAALSGSGDALAAAHLDQALAALTAADPRNPLREELVTARAASAADL